jgi:hypothetical protein
MQNVPTPKLPFYKSLKISITDGVLFIVSHKA